jgi:putative phosphoesterase
MPHIAVLADTHVPSRAERVPEWVEERIERADHAIHAGDFDAAGSFDRIAERTRELTAVRGNLDPELGLPEVATVERGGVEFVVTHGTGDLDGYEERVAGIVAEHASAGPTVGVAGHTHQPTDEYVHGERLLNPGSATGAAPAPCTSILTVYAENGEIEVTFHER